MATLTSAGVTFGDGTVQTTAAFETPGADFYQEILNGSATSVYTNTYNSSDTWTKLSGGTLALVEVWGAGGSGGRRNTGYIGGGGGGAYNAFLVPVSSLPATVTVTIGAGGASRTGSDQNGAAGGASSFGSVLSSNGGAGGAQTSSGSTGSGIAAGGVLGTPSSPYFVVGAFNALGGGNVGETGGGGGRARTVGCPATTDISVGGSVTSAGGGGGARISSGSIDSSGGTSTYGGGGSAGAATSSAGTQPGGGSGGATTTSGVGGAGRVRVTVY